MNINNRYTRKSIKLSSNNIAGATVYDDYYIPILLTRNSEIIDYVDVQKDESIFKIDRQNINPYYIELNFFSTISRNKTSQGSELTPIMINWMQNYFRNTITQSKINTDNKAKTWFDYVGLNFFALQKDEDGVTNLDKMEQNQIIWTNLSSKANFKSIDINR